MKEISAQKLLEELKAQKIAVLGFGSEGESVVKFLLKQGIGDITVCDQKNAAQLSSFKQLKELPVKRQLGAFWQKGIGEGAFDIVIRSPGVYPHLPALQKIAGKKSKTKLVSTTKFFFDLSPAPILAVTGTKGKGTTATLIYEILKSLHRTKRVWLGGNIGKPPFDFLGRLRPDDIVVFEISSFQLIDLDVSPHWAVILNITSDHLDWHKSRREYIAAKYNIVSHQQKDDIAIINADYLTSIEFASITNSQVWWFSCRKSVDRGVWWDSGILYFRPFPRSRPIPVLKESDVKLLGRHNLENVAAASLTAYLAGASPTKIAPAVRRFRGLPHRLQKITEIDGVEFIEDSFSTNPQTTIAAICSFEKPQVLILGGYDKKIGFEELGREVAKSNIRAVVLIGETANKIAQAIRLASRDKKSPPLIFAKNFSGAVREAHRLAQKGDVVLLSPACASFDMFDNYKQRGEEFTRLVKKLKILI